VLHAAAATDADGDVVDTMISGDLPEHMSPYVFFIVFNDTTFMPFNRNETSHVNTHAVSLSLSLYVVSHISRRSFTYDECRHCAV